MATIYTVADCGIVAARGDYEESGYFVFGQPIYELVTNTDYVIHRTTYSNSLPGWFIGSRDGGAGALTGNYTLYYFLEQANIKDGTWSVTSPDGIAPAPTVTLKSGSVEPASNMVLASFL